MTIEQLKVIITAETSKFKQSIADIKNQLRGTSSEAEKTGQSLDNAFKVDTTQAKQQLEDLRYSLITQKRELQSTRAEVKKANEEYKQIAKTFEGIERTVNTSQGRWSDKLINAAFPNYNDLKSQYEAAKAALNEAVAKQRTQEEAVNATKIKYEDLAHSIRKANNEIKETGNEVKKTTKEVTKLQNPFKKLTSFFNMFKLRLIRMTIMAIIRQVKESLDLLYQYDYEMGNIGGYNKSISDLRSEFKKLSADIAVAGSELLTMLAPALTQLLHLLESVVEWFNKLFAALNGKSTYTVANPEYWEDYGKQISEAYKATKQMRTLIGGFDELNTLQKQSQSNTNQINPIDMYQTKELEGAWKWISENSEGLKKLLTVLGLVAAAVSLLNKLFGGKNKLLRRQTGLEGDAAKGLQFALVPALALAASGVALLAEKLKNLPDHLPSLKPQVELQPAFNAIENIQKMFQNVRLPALVPSVNLNPVYLAISVITSLFSGIKLPALTPSFNINPVNEFVQSIKERWSSITLPQLAPNINVQPVLDGVNKLKQSISTFGVSAKQSFTETFNTARSVITNWATNTVGNIRNWTTVTAGNIRNWAVSTATNIKNATVNWATNTYNSLKTTGSNINNWITTTASNFKSWASSTATNIKNWASNIATNVGNALSSAWTNFKNFTKNTGQAVSGWWSANKATVIPLALAGLTVAGLALAAPTGGASLALVGLANGGVVDKPTNALIGEYSGARNNPEIVTPESLLKDIIDTSNGELANVYIQVGRQIIQAISDLDMEVKIGDDVIASSAARGNKAYARRTGQPLITV